MHRNCKNNHISCCILAGGQSSRFGSNKALAGWPPGNHTVIEAVISAASHVTTDITIITHMPEEYAFTGLPCRPDLLRGCGPVSGIHSALCHTSTDRVLILACDMPAVSGHFLQWLVSITTWAPAVIPESDHGPEPLHAVWHRSLIPVFAAHIRLKKTGGLRHILNDIPFRPVTAPEYRSRGFKETALMSANRPAELKKIIDAASG